MAYMKLNLERFVQKLNAGEYADASGARRALTRSAGISEVEKRKGEKALAEYFECEEVVPPARKPGRPTKVEPPHTSGVLRRTSDPVEEEDSELQEQEEPTVAAQNSERYSVLECLRIAEKIVESAGGALSVLTDASTKVPGASLVEAVERTGNTLQNTVQVFDLITTRAMEALRGQRGLLVGSSSEDTMSELEEDSDTSEDFDDEDEEEDED